MRPQKITLGEMREMGALLTETTTEKAGTRVRPASPGLPQDASKEARVGDRISTSSHWVKEASSMKSTDPSLLKRYGAKVLTIVSNVWLLIYLLARLIYLLARLIYLLAATTARSWASSMKSTDPRLLKRYGATVLTIVSSLWLFIYLLLMLDAFLYPNR
jgi:hypothetical protein